MPSGISYPLPPVQASHMCYSQRWPWPRNQAYSCPYIIDQQPIYVRCDSNTENTASCLLDITLELLINSNFFCRELSNI